MKFILFAFCILFPISCFAQDTAKLRQYLLQHRYTIDLHSDKAFDMLPALMKGKNLLVLGEGGSHELELYNKLKPTILDQLATQNLKCYFAEFGRATATLFDKYLHNKYPACTSAFTSYCPIMEHEKTTLEKGHDFRVVGIDFEIRIDFHTNINTVFEHTDLEKLPATKALLADLMDSTCLKMTHKDFMGFYREKRKEIYRNSIAVKAELGDKYNDLEYLITNPNTTRPNIDRNGKMAENFLNEITPLDTSAAYFLSIGMAHSLPNEHYTTVHKLCKNEQLKNRILVMNMYCEGCSVNGEKIDGSNTALRFMKDEAVLACFSQAANAELVLFDLSQLPPEYAYIKAYGGLLLFARNQH